MYTINDALVCITPDTEIIWSDSKFHAAISVAELKGEWAVGYNLEIKGCGEGCGGRCGAPSFGKYKKVYTTKDAARNAGLVRALEYFTEQRLHYHFSCAGVIEAIKQSMAGKQLTLF